MGFQKGNKINVGRKKTKESKEKMSESRLARKKRLGYLNSPATRKKISENNLKNPRRYWLGKKRVFSEGTRKKWSDSRMGSRNVNYKGGITPINLKIRYSLKYKQWRGLIFKRDNFTCVWCKSNKSNTLEADHIIPFSKIIEKLKFEHGIDNLYEKAMSCELLWDINNGRTLCKECHKKTDTYPENLK